MNGSAQPVSSDEFAQPMVRRQRGSGRKTMSIGVVLKALKEEFPEVTVSKIRFLESEGLVSPSRTASGYRRFTQEDVDRLRYILMTQRDNYLPLKVIRAQLEAMDSGEVTPMISGPMVSPDTFKDSGRQRITDVDVATRSGASEEFVALCLKIGLIKPDAAGLFSADDVAIVTSAKSLQDYGLAERHLKSIKNVSSRQADIIQQVSGPVARGKGDGAVHRAEEINQQVAALIVSLTATLIKNELKN